VKRADTGKMKEKAFMYPAILVTEASTDEEIALELSASGSNEIPKNVAAIMMPTVIAEVSRFMLI